MSDFVRFVRFITLLLSSSPILQRIPSSAQRQVLSRNRVAECFSPLRALRLRVSIIFRFGSDMRRLRLTFDARCARAVDRQTTPDKSATPTRFFVDRVAGGDRHHCRSSGDSVHRRPRGDQSRARVQNWLRRRAQHSIRGIMWGRWLRQQGSLRTRRMVKVAIGTCLRGAA